MNEQTIHKKCDVKIYCIYCRRLFLLLKCNTKSVILIQKNLEVPIIFYTESHLKHSAGVSENRFFLFSISEDKLHFNFSNAPLNSIHSIDDFLLLDYCPLTKVDPLQFNSYDYGTNSQNINFTNTPINEYLNITVTPKNLTNYSNINFNADDWFINKTFFNPSYIHLNDINCRLICTTGSNITYVTIANKYKNKIK